MFSALSSQRYLLSVIFSALCSQRYIISIIFSALYSQHSRAVRCIALYSQRWLALRGVLALHCVIFSAFAGHCLGFSSLASVAFLAFYSQPGCGLLGVVL